MTNQTVLSSTDFCALDVAGVSYELYLPDHRTDYIQRKLMTSGVPYEEEMLATMAGLLDRDDLVLDIGANVGNHALYLAAVAGCRVLAFEPNPHLAEAMRTSVQQNDLAERVEVHELALGATAASAHFTNLDPSNLGRQRVAVDDPVPAANDEGDHFAMSTLDLIPIDGRIKAIKIDVEGMEHDVLVGAENLIKRDLPHIFVECQTVAGFRAVAGWLVSHGYAYEDTYNATPTHHFRAVAAGETLRQIQKTIELAATRYELESNATAFREEAHRVSLRYRDQGAELRVAQSSLDSLTAQLDSLTDRNRSLNDEISDLKEDLRQSDMASHSADSAFRRVRSEALIYRDARDGRIEELRLVRGEKAAALRRLQALQTELDASRAEAVKQRNAAKARARQLRSIKRSRAYRLARTIGSPVRLVRRARSQARELLGRRAGTAGSTMTVPSAPLDATVTSPTDDSPIESGMAPSVVITAAADRGLDEQVLAAAATAARRSAASFKARRESSSARLRIAAIVDDFTRQSLGHDCDLLNLRPDNWREPLEAFDADLLFVESAWRGVDGTWHNTVPKCTQDLLDIIDFCKAASIPTIFWNKEDPVHFQTFIKTASKFDHVYTTDVDCVPRYREALGHERAHFLPFACQPRTQNPLPETWRRKNALVFAGGYYTRYKERMRDLDAILDGASAVVAVEIFDRMLGTTLDDYRFPDRYNGYIVGTLDADKIAYAYKGYRFALNLNSVKASQSMFARRAYELISCGTVTISNYSRGLKVMLGDILPMTDDSSTTTAILTKLLEDPVAYARQRLVGLRKAHREHTYRERLRYLSASIIGEEYSAEEWIVTVLIAPRSLVETRRLVALAKSQAQVRCEIIAVSDEADIRELATSLGAVAAMDRRTAASTTVGQFAAPGSRGVAVLHHDDWYGEHYLIDIALATAYGPADVIGKGYPLRAEGDEVIGALEAEPYGPCHGLTPRRALVRLSAVAASPLLPLLAEEGNPLTELSQISVDSFDYCERGYELRRVLEQRWSGRVEFDTGADLVQMLARLQRIPCTPALDTPVISSDAIAQTKTRKQIKISRAPIGVCVTSTLADRTVRTVQLPKIVDVAPDAPLTIALRSSGNADVSLTYSFSESGGAILDNGITPPGMVDTIFPPAGTTCLELGLRIVGPGQAWIDSIDLAPKHDWGPTATPSRSRVLLVTNAYPSYDRLYRNAFVHARVRSYLRQGLGVDVFRFGFDHDQPTYSEFEGVQVLGGSPAHLRRILSEGHYETILVHFLLPQMWEILADFASDHRILVWIHGADVQPWWRRTFNYNDPSELADAKLASDERLAFWHSLLDKLPSSVHFVFVSQYFADEVMEDLQGSIPRAQYSIIHNPVDETIFNYVEKTAQQRKRILSIRPYASAKYANDLSVAAVLSLSRQSWFHELDFLFIGDGPLFESTVEPLLEFPNVEIRRGFLSQPDIAALHKDYGVFLVPTRMDTQGVSRDEAMSSGLVPVTTKVSAIPEFVSEEEGYLAALDDYEGIADAIVKMYHDPEEFLRRSAAAARRVQTQTSSSIVVPQEISLIAGPSSQ